MYRITSKLHRHLCTATCKLHCNLSGNFKVGGEGRGMPEQIFLVHPFHMSRGEGGKEGGSGSYLLPLYMRLYVRSIVVPYFP